MRVNTQNVFKAWMNAKKCKKADSLWTDGSVIYSYSTAIVKMNDDGRVFFNAAKYSCTTSTHQNGLRVLLVGMPVVEVEGDSAVFG